jgi:DNA transposition AAA+ family ATPase
MGIQAVPKESKEPRATSGKYDEDLHARFLLWKDESGESISSIAAKTNRSTAAVSQYVNKKYAGNVEELEKDVLSLLRREENLEFVSGVKEYRETGTSTLMWEVIEYCDNHQKMGAVVAPSGTGKSTTCIEYIRRNRATILLTAHIKARTANVILRKLLAHVGGIGQRSSTDQFLDAIIDRLKGSKRLIIVDDAHFLNWEAFELVRKFHDCASVGVCYVGQETMYEQMKGGSRAYLFDQIYSRIAIKRDKFQVTNKDAEAIARSICPGLDKDSVEFLAARAKQKGRYRHMANLLDVAMESHANYGTPMGVPLLQEAEKFLLG